MILYQDLPKGSGDKKLRRYYRLLTNHSRLGGVRNFRLCVKGCGKRRAERICHLLKTLINALADSVYIYHSVLNIPTGNPAQVSL